MKPIPAPALISLVEPAANSKTPVLIGPVIGRSRACVPAAQLVCLNVQED